MGEKLRIKIKINKSIQENASFYFEEAKKIKKKIEGLKKAIEKTKEELEIAKKEEEKKEKEKINLIKKSEKKEWFEKFHFFFTSGQRLVIGGRNADQNSIIVEKYFNPGDLFFHADIHGGSVCILKDGEKASLEEMQECAQFAASFSNAWKNKNSLIDVYAVKYDQVKKSLHGSYVKKGSFVIIGERMWFKNIKLKLKIGFHENKLIILPEKNKLKLEKEIYIVPGNYEKGEIVKKLAKYFNVHPDDVQNLLPSGKISLVK